MRTRRITLEEADRERPPQGEHNRPQRQAMLRVLRQAMDQELTPRQRQCVELCYLRGMSQPAAAQHLGVNKSTVNRHLKKARLALRRAASYGGLGDLLPETASRKKSTRG